MDDTTKTPAKTVTIFGTEYPLTKPSKDVAQRVALASTMGMSEELKLEAIGTMIAACIGADNWASIVRQFLHGAGDMDGLFTVLKEIGDAFGAPADGE